VREREFTGSDGRVWRIRERAESRREDGAEHLTLELTTPGEHRVVSCHRDEWDVAEPDYVDLLARSVPGGASRSFGAPEDPEPPIPPEPDGLAW
jgi:hypothetical protein